MSLHKARIKKYEELSERMKLLVDENGTIYPQQEGQIITVDPSTTDILISSVDGKECYGVWCIETFEFYNRDLLDIDEAPCPPSN